MGGVQVSVVCACVCLMSTSSFFLGTLLPLYVYIRTSTEVPLSELRQRLAEKLPSRYTTSSIRLHKYVYGRTIKRASTASSGHNSAQQNELFLGKGCPLVAVEPRLMVRPWTYVCRRIEEVVYLEGKRKRT